LADHRLKYILKGRVTDFYRLQPVAEKVDDKKIRDLTVKKAETESDLEVVSKYAETFDYYITVIQMVRNKLILFYLSRCVSLNHDQTANRKRRAAGSKNL
jgi:hypothetical protein